MKVRKISAVVLSMVMAAAMPSAAMAASPEFARSESEWATLQDNQLEYSEIPDLIHEYNITVQNNRYKYNEFVKDYGHTKQDVADEYRKLASDLEGDKSGGDDAASKISDLQLQLQADNLRKEADDNVEDSEIYYLTYSQAEDNLSESAETKFISYYSGKLNLENLNEQLEVLKTTYDQTSLKQQAGTATQAEVLSAEEAVQAQEESIRTQEMEIEDTRQKLIVMLGWSGSDQPEIGDLPQVSTDDIAGIDPEADRKTAVENNYTLRINQKKLENATNEDTKKDLQKTIAANEKQIGVTVTSAWQDLKKAKLAYEQAESEAQTEARNTEIAAARYSAGVITQHELETQQHTQSEKQRSIQTASMDLLKACEVYKWDVKGLAAAE